jgi:hypothetical protein
LVDEGTVQMPTGPVEQEHHNRGAAGNGQDAAEADRTAPEPEGFRVITGCRS